jgi:trigger factor
MQVSVEELDGLERRMTVQVPAETIDTEVQKRLRELSRTARIDGFRPGKVPIKVIKRRFGAAVRDEVAGQVVQRTFFEALTQEKLRPAGGPEIDVKAAQEGQDCEFLATFEVYPEFEVTGIETLQLKRPVADVQDADLDRMIEKLRGQRMLWNAVDRAAGDGDQITIDFKGFVGDEAFEGGQGEDMPIVIGSGQFVPGFEDELKGLSKAAEKSFSIGFPEAYPNPGLAGREVRFEVTVKEVAESELPALDEDFAKSFGVEEGGIEKLRSDLRENMGRELDQAIRAQLKQHVMDGLLTVNQLDVPKVLLDQELRNLAVQAGALTAENARDAEITDELRERFGESADRRVRLGLIVNEIIRANELEPDQSKISAHIESLASTYQEPDEVRAYYRQNEEARDSVRGMVLEEQAVEWILERVQLADEATSFDAIMNPEEHTG